MPTPPPPSPQPRFSPGDEAFERLFEAHPWEQTRLGPMERWPASLRGYVRMVLKLPTPAIIFWGPEHLQLYNAGYAVIMGPRHPRYLGSTYEECWPDTYPTIHPWMERVLQGEVLEVVNAPFTLTRHGYPEETYFTFSFSPLTDEAGRIAGFLQLVTERTAEVLAERREATLRAVASPDGEPADLLAALASNPYDLPFARLYLRDEAGPVPELARRALERGAPERVEGEAAVAALRGGPQPSVWGEPVRAALALPLRAAAGEPARGVAVFGLSPRLPLDGPYRAFLEALARELSAGLALRQERLAQRSVERERQNLSDFFMQAPAPLAMLIGPEHRFLLANQPYLDMVGREVVGLTVHQAFAPGEVEPFVERLDQVYRTGQPWSGRELPLQLASGPPRSLNVSYVPLRSPDGSVKGILAFHYDVTPEATARKCSESLAAELRTALQARDEFLGIASHELKTPLTALRLQIQLAERRQGPPDPARLLKQADRLTRLIDDMLDISRIAAGKLALERAPTDLAAVVGEVLDRFEPQLAAAGSRAGRALAPGVVGDWDAYRLEQVLINLLSNALKYAPGRPVQVSAERVDGRAVLTVADQGPGVAPADRERIFERFERAVGGAAEPSGLGLGLYISRNIVEAHGGHIRVESRAGGGAAFVVSLPLG